MVKVNRIGVVGLGYVGLPLAIKLAEKYEVVGYDISEDKINQLNKGIDPTMEVGDQAIKDTNIHFTHDPSKISDSNFIIVAVPTPINENNTPDTTYVKSASEIVGKNMSKGSIVVYESTVYPGLTEEECLPILEEHSGLLLKNNEFGLGYSPERINPGDKVHTVENIVKVVSGHNDETLKIISEVYESIITAGVYKAPSIKVAEAAKVIENIQRDLNIALMNELSIIFEKMNINTNDVINAASTKWNFHKYTPGLVGGHCIGVDPYYLTHKAQQLGHTPEVILAGRRINDNMHEQVIHLTKKALNENNKELENSKILILGLTFKENVPDFRNSRVKNLIIGLKKFGSKIVSHDPFMNEELKSIFDTEYTDEITDDYDLIIIFSPHEEYKSRIEFFKKFDGPIIDIKGSLELEDSISL